MNIRTFVLTAAVGTTACAAPISSDVRVTDPAPEALRIPELAILPVIVDPGLEAIGAEASDALHAAIVQEYPGIRVIPAEQSLELMNQGDVANAYAYLVGTYEEEGVLDPDIVRDISAAIGVDHLLNLRVQYGEERALGLGQFVGETGYTGQSLRTVVQLWDGEAGSMIWRSVGDVSAVSSDLMRERDVEDLVGDVVPKLAQRLPVHGGEEFAEAPEWQGPGDDTVFMGASGLMLLAFLLL